MQSVVLKFTLLISILCTTTADMSPDGTGICGIRIPYTWLLWCTLSVLNIQDVPGGKDNILGGHSIGHSKQKTLYEHVSYSERFPR
jgi:hypothetical protein